MSVIHENLRCNKKFHGNERYDAVLVQDPDGGYFFARLRMLFQCGALGRQWYLALVTVFETEILPRDSRTGMRIVKESSERMLIDVSWVVRSVYMSPDYPRDDGFQVSDLVNVDGDLFIRLGALNKESLK
jgi:hypothetical protein